MDKKFLVGLLVAICAVFLFGCTQPGPVAPVNPAPLDNNCLSPNHNVDLNCEGYGNPVNTSPTPVSVVSSNQSAQLSCDNIFPLDVLQNAYPSVEFSPAPDNSQNSSSMFFSCGYIAIVGVVPNQISYNGHVVIYTGTGGKMAYAAILNGHKKTDTCVQSSVGSDSWECTKPVQDSIFFTSSNGKYYVAAGVSVENLGAVQSGLAEKMAQAVDSKLS